MLRLPSRRKTGHLVFGTLHTSSAAKTVDRIVDVFPAAEKEMVRAMLSESLIAVISQSGTIYMVDDDGYNVATMLAPNRLEICYLSQSPTSRIASCTEFTRQP